MQKGGPEIARAGVIAEMGHGRFGFFMHTFDGVILSFCRFGGPFPRLMPVRLMVVPSAHGQSQGLVGRSR